VRERWNDSIGAGIAPIAGSDLGLSIVERIAEQHGAVVCLEAGPNGKGL
jgi:signal transduction histidine kinase